MNNNTHPDPFPTLPPPHGSMVNLNHSKKYRAKCAVVAHYFNFINAGFQCLEEQPAQNEPYLHTISTPLLLHG